MLTNNRRTLLAAAFLIAIGGGAFAQQTDAQKASAACESAAGQSGKIVAVQVGMVGVDRTSVYISLKAGTTTYTDIKTFKDVTTDEGRAMYSLALSAAASQMSVSLTSCAESKITAIRIGQ